MTRHSTSDFDAGERFDVLRRVGAGGMGVVFEAFDRERRMRVALKTLPRLEPELLYLIKQEFRNFSDVNHPNLIHIYELFNVEETWFFSMEYLDGVNFLKWVSGEALGSKNAGRAGQSVASPSLSSGQTLDLRAETDLSLTSSAPILGARGRVGSGPATDDYPRLRAASRQLVEGVRALHAAKRLHRDIKPSNIMVTPEGRVVLHDFGLSTELRPALESAREQRVMGTLGYMAPEQAMGLSLTPASDWYSVGVVLYEALTGRLPFDDESLQVLREQQQGKPVPVRQFAPKAPVDLATLCDSLLQRSPMLRPRSEEILALLEGRAAADADPKVVGAEAPFVGRVEQLAALDDAFETMRTGRSVTVLIHGASGVGKSYLLEHYLESLARESDAVILRGRCYEAESVPYKGLDSLIDTLARSLLGWAKEDVLTLVPRDAQSLLRVFPVLKQLLPLAEAPESAVDVQDKRELRRRALRGLRELLARLGDRRHLVISIDDLQWGDMDGAVLLIDLLQPPDAPNLMLIGSYRSEYAETSLSLARLISGLKRNEALDLRVLAVEPLEQADSCEMALAMLPRRDDARLVAERIARESHGLPYFVHELVQLVSARGELKETAEENITLGEVIRRRLETLPEGALRLLETVSLAGRPLRQADAYRAANLELSDFSAAAALRTGHMARSTGLGERDLIEPFHDRIREAIVLSLPSAEKPARHALLAETLEAAGAYDAEMIGVHFEGAGDVRRAASYLARAADQAASALAFDRAATLYRHSLDLAAPEREEEHRLLVALGEALANAGRSVEAGKVFQQAMAATDGPEAIELQRRAAFQYCISGHMREGRLALADLLKRIGMSLPDTPLASLRRMLWYRFRLALRGMRFRVRSEEQIRSEVLRRCDATWSASIGLSMIDIIDGAAFQAQTLLLALDAGEPYRVARSLSYEAVHVGNTGISVWNRTQHLIAQATKLAADSGNPHAIGMALMSDGIVHFFLARWGEAIERLERAAVLFREQCTGVTWELDSVHNFVLWALYYQGEFVEMQRRMQPLLHEASERGDLYLTTSVRTYNSPMLHLLRDDPPGARSEIEHALEAWAVAGFHLQSWEAVVMLTHCDLYEGRAIEAFDRIREGWRDTRRAQLHRSQTLRIVMLHLLGEAALAASNAGDRRGLPTARRIAATLRREGIDWAIAFAIFLEAGVAARDVKAPARAAELYQAAAEKIEDVGMATLVAAGRRRAGELLGGEFGRNLVESSDRWLHEQKSDNPANLCRAYVAELPKELRG